MPLNGLRQIGGFLLLAQHVSDSLDFKVWPVPATKRKAARKDTAHFRSSGLAKNKSRSLLFATKTLRTHRFRTLSFGSHSAGSAMTRAVAL